MAFGGVSKRFGNDRALPHSAVTALYATISSSSTHAPWKVSETNLVCVLIAVPNIFLKTLTEVQIPFLAASVSY